METEQLETKHCVYHLINNLAIKYGVVRQFDDSLNHRSRMVGGDPMTIILGHYDDEELMLISFFHELGHCLVGKNNYEFATKWNYNKMMIELECWNIGLEEARKNNILFTDKAVAWGLEQVLTYEGHCERERHGYDESVAPTLWVNRHRPKLTLVNKIVDR